MNGTVLLGFIHNELLQLLEKTIVQRDLLLGRVFAEDASCFADWHTFRGRRRQIVRGSKHAGYRVCEECGSTAYSAMGKRYLFPEPPDGVDIFESDLAGLVFRAHLLEHIDLKKYRKLQVDKLHVLDPPPDGLGVLKCE